MSNSTAFTGVFPIVATPFDPSQDVDHASLIRMIDHLIATGSAGLVLLANAGEGYALTEIEREGIVNRVIGHTGGRVPIVVTNNEYSIKAALDHGRKAKKAGADALMCMPPFFGQWRATRAGIVEYFTALSDIELPLIVQDHPLSAVEMPVDFLAELANRVPAIHYYKIEVKNAAAKIRLVQDSVAGTPAGTRLRIFGGMSGVLFPEELLCGACGTMPSSAFADVLARVYRLFHAGEISQAWKLHHRLLPLLSFELNCGGRDVFKKVLQHRGWIDHATTRTPSDSASVPALNDYLQTLLAEMRDELHDGAVA